MAERQWEAAPVAPGRLEDDLQVRAVGFRRAADECGGLEQVARQRTAAIRRVLQQVQGRARQRRKRQAIGTPVTRLHQHPHAQVILVVRADAGQVRLHPDPQRLQRGPITDAGEHQ